MTVRLIYQLSPAPSIHCLSDSWILRHRQAQKKRAARRRPAACFDIAGIGGAIVSMSFLSPRRDITPAGSEFLRHRRQRVLRRDTGFPGDRRGVFGGGGIRLVDDRLVVHEQAVDFAGQFVHSVLDSVDDPANETGRGRRSPQSSASPIRIASQCYPAASNAYFTTWPSIKRPRGF